MPDRSSSEPARYERFEEKLRARPEESVAGAARYTPHLTFVHIGREERDALAAAVEALREVLNTEGSEIPHNAAVRALLALAKLDGLGG